MMVIWPPASITACSPLSWITLPSKRTVRFEKVSRCVAFIRGVASAIVGDRQNCSGAVMFVLGL